MMLPSPRIVKRRQAGPLALTMLLLAPGSAAIAEVYKGIGPDGRIFYSDQPIDGATPVDLPDAAATADNAQTTDEQPATDDAAPSAGPYASLEILTPTEGETIRNEERAIRVSLLLEPALEDGDRLSIEVDGVPVTGTDGRSTQVQLGGLALGSHRLQVRVLDVDGGAVAQSPVVHFNIRRPLPETALP